MPVQPTNTLPLSFPQQPVRQPLLDRPAAAPSDDEGEHDVLDPTVTSSLRPLANAALQAAATTGALASGLALAARSTHAEDPMHNKVAGAGGALTFALASGMQLGLSSQGNVRANLRAFANRLMATGLCAMGAAQLQGGLDGRGYGGVTAGSMALFTGLVAQLTLTGAQLGDDQRAYGNIPTPGAVRGATLACSLAGVSAAMAGVGTTLGLRARENGQDLAQFGWLSLSALASLPLLLSMGVVTRSRAHALLPS